MNSSFVFPTKVLLGDSCSPSRDYHHDTRRHSRNRSHRRSRNRSHRDSHRRSRRRSRSRSRRDSHSRSRSPPRDYHHDSRRRSRSRSPPREVIVLDLDNYYYSYIRYQSRYDYNNNCDKLEQFIKDKTVIVITKCDNNLQWFERNFRNIKLCSIHVNTGKYNSYLSHDEKSVDDSFAMTLIYDLMYIYGSNIKCTFLTNDRLGFGIEKCNFKDGESANIEFKLNELQSDLKEYLNKKWNNTRYEPSKYNDWEKISDVIDRYHRTSLNSLDLFD